MNNTTIRNASKIAHMPLWKVADFMGISEATLTRMLRHELPEEEKQRILAIIHEFEQAF